jgi:hypothetical protein
MPGGGKIGTTDLILNFGCFTYFEAKNYELYVKERGYFI